VKIISTEKPSLGGTNLDDAFAKMFASNFWQWGIETILNASNE
jgi:hypothetical protein